MRGQSRLLLAAFLLAVTFGVPAFAAPRVDVDRLVPGFVAETRNATGFPSGTGFAAPNPWGQYTAYLMLTDAKGRRTWRIEHNLPSLGFGTSQGSTMYLLEGDARALLIDTASPASAKEGVNDLKTVVRHLLSHTNNAGKKTRALDFVVANTHSHGDHTGENARMSDRTIYYMDGDWPAQNAPANYAPIREGGGATTHGKGQAVGEIDLGGRVIKAIDVPPHTDGSVAYLDAQSQLLFTGDALGSAWPYLQRGPITRYVKTARHLMDVTAPYPELLVFPAHFYQISAFDRAKWPREKQLLNRQYIADQLAAAESLVNGTGIGTPFLAGVRDYWVSSGTAKIVYTPDTIGAPGEALASNYRVMAINGAMASPDDNRGGNLALNKISGIAAKFYLIRGPKGESLYLLRGSSRALLIGAGSGAVGLSDLVTRLADGVPLEIAILDADATQTGGLAQLTTQTIYTAASVLANTRAKILKDGDIIDLGTNADGTPLRLEAQSLAMPGKPSLTLLSRGDRAAFIGTAFGTMAPGAALEVADPIAFAEALNAWMVRAGGRFSIAYPSPSPAWFTDPAYLEQLQSVLSRAINGRGAGKVAAGATPDTVRVTAELATNASAAIIAPRSKVKE